MLRQDVIDVEDAVKEDEDEGAIFSQRLSIVGGAANEKADGSRRGSEKQGYHALGYGDNLEMDQRQQTPNTAYGGMGGVGLGDGRIVGRSDLNATAKRSSAVNDYDEGAEDGSRDSRKKRRLKIDVNASGSQKVKQSFDQAARSNEAGSSKKNKSGLNLSRSRSGHKDLMMSMDFQNGVKLQQSVEMIKIDSRPQSGVPKADSFMTDNNEGSHRMEQHQIEEVKIAGQQQSEDSFNESSFETDPDDVSEETHRFSDESSSDETVMSSDSDEGPDLYDQPIRVYDARFKIPAQSNIGQLMSAKNSAELSKG